MKLKATILTALIVLTLSPLTANAQTVTAYKNTTARPVTISVMTAKHLNNSIYKCVDIKHVQVMPFGSAFVDIPNGRYFVQTNEITSEGRTNWHNNYFMNFGGF